MNQQKSSSSAHDGQSKHVLIVDDDQELAQTLCVLLESHNYQVSVCSSGVEALKFVMQTEVDVVLCDLMMPQMPGDMFFKAVERVKPNLCRRFIFITGYEGHPKVEDFLKKVSPVILYKPVTPGKLLGTIHVLFQRLANPSKSPALGKTGETSWLTR